MSITETRSAIIYGIDGMTTDFDFFYPVMQIADLQVSAKIGPVFYIPAIDYISITTPNQFGAFPNGLTIRFFTAPLASGQFLLIARKTEIIQTVQFVDNDPFTADAINFALDRLTLAIQDCDPGQSLGGSFHGIAWGPPDDGDYLPGDWFKNAQPLLTGDPFGWICIFPGTPGTWQPFGAVTI